MWTFISVALAAAPPTVGGIVRPEVAVDIARDFDDENGFELNTWSRAWARGEFENGDGWFLEAKFQHHFLHAEDDKNDVTTENEGWWDLDVGETGWDGKIAGPVRLRIGALTERWGKLELLPVNDVLNPRDGRSGLVTPVDFQRIPIPMAVVSVAGGPLRSETVLIPFSTADQLFLRETDWSYVRQGQVTDLLVDMQFSQSGWTGGDLVEYTKLLPTITDGVNKLNPAMRRGLDAAVNGNNLPEAFAFNGEIGQRFEIQAKNLNIGLMGGYLRSRQAKTNLAPELAAVLESKTLPDPAKIADLQAAVAGGPLKVRWPRTFVAGTDFSVLAGPLQIRGDAGIQTAKVVRLQYAQARKEPQLGVGLGVDYIRGSSFQATVEARWLKLMSVPNTPMLFSLPDQVQIAGGVRWIVAHDRLTMQMGGAYDFSYDEFLARP